MRQVSFEGTTYNHKSDAVIAMSNKGHRPVDIAKELGMTPNSVTGILTQYRKNFRHIRSKNPENVIFETRVYGAFRRIIGNRQKSQRHIAKLKESIRKRRLFNPIIVNERMEVIDGQHTLEALQDLGLPVEYRVCPGYRTSEVQTYNSNTRGWNATDYIESQAEIGNREYQILAEFKKKYPDLNWTNLWFLLNGSKTPSEKVIRDGKFRLKITKTEAHAQCQRIVDLQKVFKYWHKSSFIRAIMRMSAHPDYNHKWMTATIKSHQSELNFFKTCTTRSDDWILKLQSLYNKKLDDDKQVNFIKY